MTPDGLAEDQFRQLVELAPDAMLSVDADGRIIWLNAEAERLYGYPRDELLGQPIDVLLPEQRRALHASHRQEYLAAASKRAMGAGRDVVGRRKDGSEFPAEITLAPLQTPRGLVVTTITRDLTERHRVENERLQLVRERVEAEAASRAKDEFLATLSHELRTPLQAILGWVRMLRSGALDETVSARALETIERNARLQARMVDDLLEVSRIVSGKLKLDVRDVELPLVVEAAVESLRTTAYARRIRVNVLVDPAVPAVSGDVDRLQQVVWNLIFNAIKASPDGGKVEVRVEPNENGRARIAVTDSGKGIDPSLLGEVFERFTRSPASGRAHGGLGLGLAIVRNLVELHGGTIEAHNTHHAGSRFVVELPVAATEQPAAAAIASEQQPVATASAPSPTASDGAPEPAQAASTTPAASSRLDGLSVLVVDDEPDTLEVVGAALRHAGAVVESASSAGEALEKFRVRTPDVLISDLAMPGENGYQLIAKVRALGIDRGGKVPAVALSAYTGPEDRRQALTAGFQLYVAKPVEPFELVKVVRRLSPEVRAG